MVHKTARRHLNKFYITWNYIITLDCSHNADGSTMVGRLTIVIKPSYQRYIFIIFQLQRQREKPDTFSSLLFEHTSKLKQIFPIFNIY